MSGIRLIFASLFHYRWVNLSILAGVALTAAILSGALVVGDSVKESLRRNAESRISKIGPVFLGGERYVSDGMVKGIAADLGEEIVVAAILQIEGTAVNRSGGQRINRVQIVGVDESFWSLSLGESPPTGFSDDRWVGINAPFADRIGAEVGETLIVRVELPGALSKDAPLSGESDQTTPFTVEVSEIVGAEAFGLYSLRAEQIPPSTLFVKRSRLEQILEQPGMINVIAASTGADAAALAAAANANWGLEDLQLAIRPLEDPSVSAPSSGEDIQQLVSSRVFFDEIIVRSLNEVAERTSPVLTYLATEIVSGDQVTPYSMVAGVGDQLNEIIDGKWRDDEILLSDWLAEDLGAAVGDPVTLVYNVVGPGRAMVEQKKKFKVGAIKKLGENGWNESWTPDFPGIFDVEDLDSWEPGIPIDREKIRDKDDDYWDEYRATPKAFVSLTAAREMWSNRFGNATAVRYLGPAQSDGLADALRAQVDLEDLGMAIRNLPAEAESAVSNSFDFGALFASMSFFLIVSALILAALVFIFGIEQRSSQIGLFLALGFTRRRIRGYYCIEACILAVLGSLVGLLMGYVYTRLALYGMSGVWKDAAAGIEFVYHLRPVTLVISFFTTVILSLVVVGFSSRRVSAIQPSQLISGSDEVSVRSRAGRVWDKIGLVSGALGGLGCLFAPKVPGTMAEQGLFFGAGFLFVLAGVSFSSLLIRRFLRPSQVLSSLGSLGRQHTVRRRGRSLAVIGLMAAGVFMVTAINSFRLDGERGAERRDSGTGGFPYVGESTLPVYEDLNTEEGQEKYGLTGKETEFSFVSFRVSDGEDASCLNLNRAQRPRLLGVPTESMIEKDPFSFVRTLEESGESSWELLQASIETEDGVPVLPGLIDQNTATYALQKGLGDLVVFETASGESFAVQLVGFLDTSLLQGSLLISEQNFIEFFPDAGGYQFFLVDGESVEVLEPIAAHLTRMLGDLGLEMRPSTDRLNEFNAVQNTYLGIFSTLGGLGIILGTIGLAIIVGRNVLERQGQLGVMQAMGFTRKQLAGMVLSEHWFLHVTGVVLGFFAAMIAVFPQLVKSVSSLPWGLLLGVNGGVLIGGLIFCAVAARSVLYGNLMEAIRRE